MIFIKTELDKDIYDMALNKFTSEQLHRFGYLIAYDNKYVNCIKKIKKCALKIINNKYYLIMVIEPEPTNSYVDLSDNDNGITNPENFRKFCEWADRVIKGIEDEKN